MRIVLCAHRYVRRSSSAFAKWRCLLCGIQQHARRLPASLWRVAIVLSRSRTGICHSDCDTNHMGENTCRRVFRVFNYIHITIHGFVCQFFLHAANTTSAKSATAEPAQPAATEPAAPAEPAATAEPTSDVEPASDVEPTAQPAQPAADIQPSAVAAEPAEPAEPAAFAAEPARHAASIATADTAAFASCFATLE